MCAATGPNVTRLVGQSMPSLEAPDKAAGRIEYMADLTVPGMAHAKVVRSPLPHARIVSIDASEARAMPGVVCVLTRDEVRADPDVEEVYGFVYRDAPLVAMDKVRHQGDIVAVVVADDLQTAEAAAELVDVDYDELPAVMNVREALADGAQQVHEEFFPIARSCAPSTARTSVTTRPSAAAMSSRASRRRTSSTRTSSPRRRCNTAPWTCTPSSRR